MKIQPYRYTITTENNAVYDFIINNYKVEVEIDELADNKIVRKTCECPDNLFRKKDCKHILEALNQLEIWGIETFK